MTLKECYTALGLKQGADLTEIKTAYRRLAFSLHPDLNPHIKDAARRFQIINEAYVTLSQAAFVSGNSKTKEGAYTQQNDDATAKAKDDARRAYSNAKKGYEERIFSAAGGEGTKEGGKEEVLRDILNDPFARRVFEDIYSHINKQGSGNEKNRAEKIPFRPAAPRSASRDLHGKASAQTRIVPGDDDGMFGKVKGWLRKQIDDEQVVKLPAASLVPGARVRLEIQHGFSERPQVIEITLPKEFVPGKPVRLKGMGRRVGNWKGDLYVRIEPV